MTTTERNEILATLKCPTCGGPIVIYSDALACQDITCGGLFGPMDIQCKLTLQSLQEEFPELRSVSGMDGLNPDYKPPAPKSLRQRSAISKQVKSAPGQLSL